MVFPGAGSLPDTENPLRHGKLPNAKSIPGELIDWISYLDKVRHAAPADLDDLPCRETLIKQFGDMQQVEKEFSRDER